MLVLRRKVGECLVIDGDIVVEVLAVEHGRVKIGIQAPPEVSVARAELLRDEIAEPEQPVTLLSLSSQRA